MEAPQQILYNKTATQASNIAIWGTMFNVAGGLPAGTLAGTSTAAGVVPTDATTGCPTVDATPGGKTSYLGSVELLARVAAAAGSFRYRLCDMLFKAGAYAFNAATSLAAQPSYSGRIPNSDYKGTEIWFECVTAFTGLPSLAVTYTNQDGTTGRTTGTVNLGANAPIVGRMVQLPLQAGDSGVQKIESVTATVATVGTFNILVLRPLWMGRVISDILCTHGPDLTDLPIVFDTSALIFQGMAEATPIAQFDAVLGIING